MKQRFVFEKQEVVELATKSNTLFSWIQDNMVEEQLSSQQLQIPYHLLLISSSIAASGFLVLMDKFLPDGGCWGNGGCLL
ncbi:MAG: hypothetical protein H6657_00090 [Ardenticatenaceae bacterium]|nr:hypothetical protein [Ardenticatenaceae bacterium]